MTVPTTDPSPAPPGRPGRADVRRVVGGPPERRRFAVVVLPVLAVVVPWYLGVDPWHALAFGAVALTIAVLWRGAPDWDEAAWRPGSRPPASGVRDDVSRLSMVVGRGHLPVGPAAVRRLRAVAAVRLARHGVDLDDPADAPRVAALLGPHAPAVLRGDVTRVKRPAFVACVDGLERLDRAPSNQEQP
ncbi:hypothetical protein ACFT5B_09290 [Luteimicrobium sp. NPDC057192]|uniref:hypothetical protein n=1 Tax=Luteimicrobium sp. NPDC057192 TaxID=3346042 RepID=UPI003627278E